MLTLLLLLLIPTAIIIALQYAGLITILGRWQRDPKNHPIVATDNLQIHVTSAVITHVREVLVEHGLDADCEWSLRVAAIREKNQSKDDHKVDVVVEPPAKGEVVHDAGGVFVFVPREQTNRLRGVTLDFKKEAGQSGIIVRPANHS